ncbi:MAG TPA: hypothetical protein VG844_17600 [Terracidiphilus sp.]|nr:hypothetical protein [Terracidiphilus sp.]
MKREASLSLSLAAACLLLSPAFVQARSINSTPATSGAAAPALGSHEAGLMVPAQASLLSDINAQKIQTGHLFRARLTDTVHLKNGQKLPDGTVLWGKVTADKLQADGKPALTLRFTRAVLKNGRTIPIRAAIMGISGPQYNSYGDSSMGPIPWNGTTLQIDQIGAISGVDLHSKIAGTNSGVFVATKKDNVKLSRGSQLTLAIAERGNKSQHSSMGSGA